MKVFPDYFQPLHLLPVVELTNGLYPTLLDQCVTMQRGRVKIDLYRQENSLSYTVHPTFTFLLTLKVSLLIVLYAFTVHNEKEEFFFYVSMGKYYS